ncbi:MAG: hypothetical protein JXA18_06965 [Chitinispirillaceae bacterium]|nr:hypothetical protein [Chitinispirillaceae bacterium]
MIVSSELSLETVLLAGYVFSSSLLNIVALFISSFYQHRLHQPSPQAGFVIAVLFSFVYIFLLFFGTPGSMVASIVSVVSLLVYGITSSYSILMLFFTMRNVRK